MVRTASSLLVLTLAASAPAVEARRQQQQFALNPIRKVVTMLQDMQRKVTAEGETEKALFDKFMCFCKTSRGSLTQGVEDAKAKIASLSSALEETGKQKEQTGQSLNDNQGSRAAAKADMAKATALREKEAEAFSKEESDLKTNIAALAKAIPAIEAGMSGSFLQTADASIVRTLALEKAELPDNLRQELVSFLSGKGVAGYVPQSGEIVGILKTIQDEMKKSLEEATIAEKESQTTYEGLIADKKKEVGALSVQVENELTRTGKLGVDIASMSNDLEDTKESLAQDTKFLAELESGCATKAKEWEVIKQTRAEELVALADTIKVLNDDDALELFKKTLPSTGNSFAQITASSASVRAAALQAVRTASSRARGGQLQARPELGLIAMAISGKKAGFDKVVSMINEMAANLAKEQKSDDGKKEYCNVAFDASDDQKKALELSISDSATAIDTMKGSIAILKEESAALEAGIKALDKSVAQATDMRKAEHKDYNELMTSDATAKEVLLWAKNRLNQFYNPKLYKPPPKRELSEEERITENFGGVVPTAVPGGIAGTGIGASFVQIREHSQAALPPAPEAAGAYMKKTGESNGVIAMIDLLVKDLDKETQEADVTEKDSQKEYESMMADAAQKRAGDSKSVTDKEGAKANEEELLEAETEKKVGASKELARTLQYIHSLHGECDWLVKYYDVRKSARAGEVDSLMKAKAVLSGADYSL